MSNTASESRKKNIIVYSVFGALLLVFCVYAYESFFATSAPPPSTAAVVIAKPSVSAPRTGVNGRAQSTAQPAGTTGQGVAPGVAATKMASTSSSLDPTLDERAMLRTESLVYSGTGRNIFSLVYVPPPPKVSGPVPSARPDAAAAAAAMAPTGPPPPPPINLKFFGTELAAGGKLQAFLLHDEDVYLAAEGDIVARRYKIVSIGSTNVKVEDLTNENTQTLPLQTN